MRHPRTESEISGFSIAAFYLGIGSLFLPVIVVLLIHLNRATFRHLMDAYRGPEKLDTLLCLLSIALAVVGIGAGWKARKRIKGSDGKLKGKGRAWTGLVMGSLGIMIYVPALIFVAPFALGYGCILRSRVGADQASAVGALRTIHNQAETYRATYRRGYPIFLAVLGPPQGSSPSNVGGAGLIDERLASGTKSEYVFIYQVTAKDEMYFPNAYTITASPLTGCGTGNGNCYFTDETGVIRMEVNRTPDQHSLQLPG